MALSTGKNDACQPFLSLFGAKNIHLGCYLINIKEKIFKALRALPPETQKKSEDAMARVIEAVNNAIMLLIKETREVFLKLGPGLGWRMKDTPLAGSLPAAK